MGVHYENIKMTTLGTKMPYLVVFGFYYGARLISDHCSRYVAVVAVTTVVDVVPCRLRAARVCCGNRECGEH